MDTDDRGPADPGRDDHAERVGESAGTGAGRGFPAGERKDQLGADISQRRMVQRGALIR